MTYAGELQEQLETLVRTSQSIAAHDGHEAHGAVFVLRGDQISQDDRLLLQSAARAVLLSRRGSLAEQVTRLDRPDKPAATILPAAGQAPTSLVEAPVRPELEFFNGLGGLDADGREYVTVLGPEQTTPAPWINVIANASTSGRGSSYFMASSMGIEGSVGW